MSTERSHRLRQIVARTLVISSALVLWFLTQAMIGNRPLPSVGLADRTHQISAGLNALLLHDRVLANILLVISSLVIDVIGASLLLISIFGASIRPFLGLLLTFVLRQVCQAMTALPVPENMIWHDPGVPSLLVTYGVATDLFFSGHTSIAVLGALELARTRRRWCVVLGSAIAAFEIGTVLVLRAHYFLDVYAGLVTAILMFLAAERLSGPVERWLRRWAL